MKLRIHDHEGALVELTDVAAPTLMHAIRDSGLNLTAQCGGSASCGTCHVYVDDVWTARITPAGGIEDSMLDVVEERRDCSRLSCQIALTKDLDGLTVTLAPGSEFA